MPEPRLCCCIFLPCGCEFIAFANKLPISGGEKVPDLTCVVCDTPAAYVLFLEEFTGEIPIPAADQLPAS